MTLKMRPHIWRLAAAGLVLLLALMALTPGGRALAQRLLELGPFRFTGDETIVERTIAENPEQLVPAGQGGDPQGVTVPARQFKSAAEASVAAGFTVLYPTYLPESYRRDSNTPVKLLYNSQGIVADATADFTTLGYEEILSYRQIPYSPDPERDPFEIGIGDAQAQPITVNGGEGVFLEELNWGSRLDENGQPVAVPYNVMIWIQDVDGRPFQFWLYSSERLPLHEMLAIAESLAP